MGVFVDEFPKAVSYQYEYNVVWLIGLNDQVILEWLLNHLQQTKDELRKHVAMCEVSFLKED